MAFINHFEGFEDIGALPSPSGSLGSKTNPYKINKLTTRVENGYIPENASNDRGAVTIPQGSKLYFEIDPDTITGQSISAFGVHAVFYEGAGTVCRLVQDKTTGIYSSEVCFGSDGLIEIINDGQPYTIANTKFLYALVGSPNGDLHEAIWINIVPYIGAEIATQPTVPQVIQPSPASIISAPIQITPGGGDIMALAPSTYDPYIDFLRARGVSETELPALLAARNVTLSTPPSFVPSQGTIQPGVSSIMAGFPTWAWIVIAGIGVTMLFGRKKKVSE